MKNRFDYNSMIPKIFIYLMGFGAIILALTWVLQTLFMNTFYEQMKINEVEKISSQIEEQYRSGDQLLGDTIQRLATSDDVYVIIETLDGSVTFSPNSESMFLGDFFNREKTEIKKRLTKNPRSSVSLSLSYKEDDYNVLAYGKLLNSTRDNYVLLYIISPLYPMSSTITILQDQLIMITIIALILAIILSFFLSRKIAKPLGHITKTAVELGRGNYDIHFESDSFTEIDTLADTLNTVTAELNKTNQYQQDLIANVSHDLKTPLTMIKSYAEMIRDISGDSPQKRDAHLQVIIDETDRLNTLVSDMTSLSRMQSGQIQLERVEFDLVETVASVMETYNILAEQEGYVFTVNMPDYPVVLSGDQGKMKQVISNLISNATKYCGQDKAIEISITITGNNLAVFRVSDHGQGISPGELPHVWDRYFKTSTNHVRTTEGSGLGLSICKEILILHGYRYGADSVLEKGSTFWFSAPCDVLK